VSVGFEDGLGQARSWRFEDVWWMSVLYMYLMMESGTMWAKKLGKAVHFSVALGSVDFVGY